jgi:predicted ATP-grasp superfamily ATP-dependent carboligase
LRIYAYRVVGRVGEIAVKEVVASLEVEETAIVVSKVQTEIHTSTLPK